MRVLGTKSTRTTEGTARTLVRSVVVAFLGWKARSIFGLKALVELVLCCYAAGLTVDEVQVETSTLAFSSGAGEAKIMDPLETEILSSWTAVVYLACDRLGLSPRDLCTALGRAEAVPGAVPGGGLVSEARAAGMGPLVEAALGQWREGRGLDQLFVDELVATEGGQKRYSQGEDMMRQISRIVVATAEVVTHLGLVERPAAFEGADPPRQGLESDPVGALPWKSSLPADTLDYYLLGSGNEDDGERPRPRTARRASARQAAGPTASTPAPPGDARASRVPRRRGDGGSDREGARCHGGVDGQRGGPPGPHYP